MSNRFFPRVGYWDLPQLAFTYSLEELAADGVVGRENIVLWLGRRVGPHGQITHVVRLRGPGVVKGPDSLRVDAALINDVTDHAIRLGVTLIGHIHTHGPGHGTDLSDVDELLGPRVPYYLSVVAPDYALREGIAIVHCGVHVFELSRGYRPMTPAEIALRVRMIGGSHVSVVTVGGSSDD